MTPLAYAAMCEALRLSGEMTPDHPEFWPAVIAALRATGLSYAQIAAEAKCTRPSLSRWIHRKDRPRDHTASALLRLLVASVPRGQWAGLGGK